MRPIGARFEAIALAARHGYDLSADTSSRAKLREALALRQKFSQAKDETLPAKEHGAIL